jgi:hypothetical protein
VNPALVQRQAALAGVALLAAVGALALSRDDSGAPASSIQPQATWREASVGVYRGSPRRAECSTTIGPDTMGIVHPVLPCGVKLVVSGGGRTVRTEVVGRGPVGLRHEFDLTQALASALGVLTGGTIRWQFAG